MTVGLERPGLGPVLRAHRDVVGEVGRLAVNALAGSLECLVCLVGQRHVKAGLRQRPGFLRDHVARAGLAGDDAVVAVAAAHVDRDVGRPHDGGLDLIGDRRPGELVDLASRELVREGKACGLVGQQGLVFLFLAAVLVVGSVSAGRDLRVLQAHEVGELDGGLYERPVGRHRIRPFEDEALILRAPARQ